MGLRDYVEPGRVCFINYGEDYGKMVVIVDFVDINRVMVDGMGQFPRVLYPLKRLTLTKLKVANILKGARTGTLKK
jgi:large subunit ribosomal protein L14e